MAAETNTPDKGTGTLSLDDAVEQLMRPLPSPPRAPQPPQEQTASADAEPLPPQDGNTDEAPDTDEPADETETDDEQTDETDAEAPPDEDTAQSEPSYTVTIEGKAESIPVSELVKGYQRQAVFTRRSQELAADRSAYETERTELQRERGQYSQLLSALQAQITAGGETEPDWQALQQSDPVAFAVQHAYWQQRNGKLQAIASEQQRLAGEQRRDAEAALQKHVEAQARLLLEKVPAYKDPKAREKDRHAIRDFAIEAYGFTEQEIANLIDHRAVLVLRDARAYRELQQKKPQVEKRVMAQNPPMTRNRGMPVNGVPSARVKALDDRLNRTGRLQDAVELEMARSRASRRDLNGNGRSGS